MTDTLPAWAMEQAREVAALMFGDAQWLNRDAISVARALVAADKAATERERERINSMPKSWELVCENEDRSDLSTDLVWKVYTVHGGLNDREWSLLGRGDTPSNAIDAAFIAAALAAIEAQGLAIVPVKMTQAQFDACAKVAWASPDIYDAMIQAGRITEPATPAVNIPETFY